MASCRKLAITLIDFKMVDGVERNGAAFGSGIDGLKLRQIEVEGVRDS